MKQYVVGIDVGATNTKIALLNLRGRIIARDSFTTKQFKRKALVRAVSATVKSLLRSRGVSKREVLGLGIGVPGLVDFKKGLVFYCVNIPHWRNVPLKKMLEKATGLPAFIDNDVKVMALGELIYGAGRGYSNIVCLTLGTGVGGAIIIDNRLYRGADLVAGEIGHIPINEGGAACNCGGSGCLEAYVGREYFLRKARREIRRGVRSTVKKMAKNHLSQLTPEILHKAARKGDPFARRMWAEYGRHIGNALVGVINFFNPECVVIGGGMAGADKFIFSTIRSTIRKNAMKIQKKSAKIVKASLGNDAGVIGAAELVKRNLRS